MLESLNRPNIKNIVLEEVQKDDRPFLPSRDLGEAYYQTIVNQMNHNFYYLRVIQAGVLKALYPDHHPEDLIDFSIEDAIDFDLKVDPFYALRTVAFYKILFPDSDSPSISESLLNSLERLNNIEPEIRAEYSVWVKCIDEDAAEPYSPESLDSLREQYLDNEANPLLQSRLLAYTRILNPSIQLDLSSEEWAELKNYDSYEHNLFLGIIAADEISFDRGLKIHFKESLKNVVVPPYPVIEKT